MNSSKTITQSRGIDGMPLSKPVPEDEFLHPVPEDAHYATTETSYFGFNIPESQINGEIYIWFHPRLHVMSASVYIWKGIKTSTLTCEYINHFGFLPMLEGDIDDYGIEELGLKVKVIEPLNEINISCQDEDRDMAFSIGYKAIMPPAGRPGGQHFAQSMRTRGQLQLAGTDYEIDGYFTRDRSWAGIRKETASGGPPMTWMVGAFNDELAFHVLAFDDPAKNPEWLDAYPGRPAGKNLIWGYVRRDGETVPLASASKLTTRDTDGLAPTLFELSLTEVGGHEHEITGSVTARMPWQTWQNMNVYFCQTRWKLGGKVGWGDSQDIQYNDFVHRFQRS